MRPIETLLVTSRFSTRLTIAEQFYAATRNLKSILMGQLLVHSAPMTTLKLDDLAASQAYQVLVLIGLSLIVVMIGSEP
jgi:hypothetical protein